MTLHPSSRYSSSCQTRCSMSLITVSSAAVILCFISSMLAGRGGTKTSPFMYVQRKKSRGERSGNRVEMATKYTLEHFLLQSSKNFVAKC